MIRGVLRVLGWVSLFLCVVSLAVWADSYRHPRFATPRFELVREDLAKPVVSYGTGPMPLKDQIDYAGTFAGALGFQEADVDIVADWPRLTLGGVNPVKPKGVPAFTVLGSLLVGLTNDQGIRVRATPRGIWLTLPGDGARDDDAFERSAWFNYSRAAFGSLHRRLPKHPNLRDDVTWKELLGAISTSSGSKIQVDWNSLKSAGMGPDTVAHPGRNYSCCADMLRIALAHATPGGEAQFRASGDWIEVASRREFDERDVPYVVGISIVFVLAVSGIGLVVVRWRMQGKAGERKLRVARRIGAFLIVAGALTVVCCSVQPWEFNCSQSRISVSWSKGVLQAEVSPADPMAPYYRPSTASPTAGVGLRRAVTPPLWDRLVRVSEDPWPLERKKVETPIYVPVALSAVPPAFVGLMAALRRSRRARALARRCCPTCGYDLRASLSRCPECGSVIEEEPLPRETLISRGTVGRAGRTNHG